MSLGGIFEGMREELAKREPELLFAGPGERYDTSRPRRITWSPFRATHMTPGETGGRTRERGPLLRRRWLIAVDIWGQGLEDTEHLVDLFIGVAHLKLSQNGYQPGEEDWNPGGVTADGSVCRYVFPLLTPIRRLPEETVPVTRVVAAVNGETTINIQEPTP